MSGDLCTAGQSLGLMGPRGLMKYDAGVCSQCLRDVAADR